MRTLISRCILFVAVLTFLVVGAAEARQSDWERIDLEGPIKARLPDGSLRILEPSCSGGPQRTEADRLVPASTDYYFFIQRGKSKKLLIALDGGGACWDAVTCIGSPLAPPPAIPAYTVALDGVPALLAGGEGIFDRANPKNPFRHYTKIFIPYCTADIHWGSKETKYVLQLAPNDSIPWTIHHRGTDNFLAVLDWLQNSPRGRHWVDLRRARDVTVTGASAGGYGADLAFAYVAELTPKARLNLISDSAIGVLTRDFYTAALYNPNPRKSGSEAWGVRRNFPSWVSGFNDLLFARGAAHPNGFVPSIFAALARYKPRARTASLTSNLDPVQVLFYGLMRGEIMPSRRTARQWYYNMARMTAATASLPRYRFFIDNGTFHTFIASNEHFYEVGANGLPVSRWVGAMIKSGNRAWENLDAGPPRY